MIQVKTRDLEGPALDWAAAKTECWDDETMASLARQYAKRWPDGSTLTTDWRQGGLLIERNLIELHTNTGEQHGEHERWYAVVPVSSSGSRGAMGPTPLVAAMRALVFAKLGDTIDVPGNLISASTSVENNAPPGA